MLRRRPKLPVLARVPVRRSERTSRPGSLGRAELEAFGGLLEAIGDSRVVLTTGYDGKLAVALGLSAAAVSAGRDAVLAECDLARPTLAATIGLDESPGLAEYLRFEAEASQILQSVVLAGPAAGRATSPLVCVTGGTPTSQGPTLLASESLRHVIEKLRSAYRLVVLDGPELDDEHSLLTVAALADMTLACCPAKEVPKRLRRSLDGLVEPAL